MFPITGNFPIPPTLVGLTVAKNGAVKDVLIVDKSGNAQVDDAAKACVSAWRYRPATRHGKPVEKIWQDVMRWDMHAAPTNAITIAQNQPIPVTQQATHQQVVTPISIGRPHTCTNFYPTAAISVHAEGRALMSFHVATEGSTKDITVAKSSGNADLDAASLACVAQWLYRPAMDNGTPIETAWQANIQWSIPTSLPLYDTGPIREEGPSCAAFYTPEMIKQRPNRSRVLEVTIGVDGAVSSVVPWTPADALLDDASMACAKTWHYKPALKAGVPVEAKGSQTINWSVQALLSPKPPRSCAKFAGPGAVAPPGIEGISGVHFRVTQDGRAEDVALDRSSTSDALDQAALASAATWRFETQSLALPPSGYPQHVIVDWQRTLKH